jgi:pimeloyl-ACP methyl ester carboxylesterase
MEAQSNWVLQSLAMVPERTWLDMPHARIEVLSWGAPSAPGVLLTHGFAANADWWSAIAPRLAKGRRVVAFSFSGMGQSDWCDRYTLRNHAREIELVAEATGLFAGPAAPVIAAHSFGGFCSLYTVAQDPSRWGGLVLVDSRVDNSLRDLQAADERKEPRFVSDPEELISRFRLMPKQECMNVEAFAAAAAKSVRQLADAAGNPAWCWAADPNLFVNFDGVRLMSLLGKVSCPMAYLVGERSYILKTGVLDKIQRHFPRGTPVVRIPDAAHHAILDQPATVTALLDMLLTIWRPPSLMLPD